MKYSLECIEPNVFNWSEGVLANMKEKINRSKDWCLNNFGYASILIYFALDRIPLFWPQRISYQLLGLSIPRMRLGVDIMSCHGGCTFDELYLYLILMFVITTYHDRGLSIWHI